MKGFIKIISGALLGIGLGITFIVIAAYATNYFSKKFDDNSPLKAEESSDISGIEFIEHKDQQVANKVLVMGSLVNKNKKKIKSIKLEAEFFKNGEFVDECTEYLSTNLKTGETENFKVSCGGVDYSIL